MASRGSKDNKGEVIIKPQKLKDAFERNGSSVALLEYGKNKV